MIYLPYLDFYRSAKCLSDKHLIEQRNSLRDNVHALVVPGIRVADWAEQWRGHITQLLWLTDATLRELRRRGRSERGVVPWMLDHDDPMPNWMGDPEYHAMHRRALLALDPAHYGRMGW